MRDLRPSSTQLGDLHFVALASDTAARDFAAVRFDLEDSEAVLRARPGRAGGASALARFLDDAVLVGHGPEFDPDSLREHFEAAAIGFRAHFLDVRQIVERLVGADACTLERAAAAVGVSAFDPDDVVQRARVTGRVLREVIHRKQFGGDFDTLGDLARMQRGPLTWRVALPGRKP